MEKANTKRMGKGIVTALPFDSKEILTPEEAGMLEFQVGLCIKERKKVEHLRII